jgi:ABC-type sugar transport system substrate-binding protein
MRPFAKWRAAFGLALLVSCAALLLAACGGSSSSSSSSSGSGGEEGTTAGESTTASSTEGEGEGSAVAEVPEPVTEPPTEFPIETPLKETPKPHKLTWLACSLPICQEALSEGYHEAAGALGWPIKQVNYETLKAAEGVQTALNENPDYIAITGIPPAAFEAQAKEAIKKKIPILSGYDTTPPEPTKNGLYYQYGNAAAIGLEGEEIGRWMIHDSEGKANAVTLTIGEYPILTAEVEALEGTFKECPECSLGTISVTAEEVGEGKVPNKLVAYLQSNPETEYVEYTFSDLSTGVGAALKGAGLNEKVTQVGVNATTAVMHEIVKGEQAAWTMQPQRYGDWLTLDVASRLSEGMPLEPYEEEGLLPTWVVDNPETAESLLTESEGLWNGPEGFEEKFEELWGLK